ncbi:hypothetical protein O181_120193 [Austropuccinia psidii MF-1]|uniref:Uncharacterized protein n=1 Tax=Austropuccinia psidii MF-1 TaxID=1389203 RepID=A0A9Q3KFK0_9BASI|nr:hypothetical protein [Austropuccinia psidii MF-1]
MPHSWILHNDLIGLNTNSLVMISPYDTLVIQSDSRPLLGIHIPLRFGSSIDLPFIDINSSIYKLTESSAENDSSAEDYYIKFNHCNPEETNSPPKTGTQQHKHCYKRSEVYNHFKVSNNFHSCFGDGHY